VFNRPAVPNFDGRRCSLTFDRQVASLDANLAERFPDHGAVAIGWGLMAAPEILPVDELSLGSAPIVVQFAG
jgi:hypothetical protein